MDERVLAWLRTYEVTSNEGGTLLAIVVVDVAWRGSLDEAFRQVGERVEEAEQEAIPLGGRVFHSVLTFGAEPSELRIEEVHAAYDRMWAARPHLWEAVQRRGLPSGLWLIDAVSRPYYGIVQPAKHGGFEMWGFTDLRDTEPFHDYRAGNDQWTAAVFPLAGEILTAAQSHVRANRDA